MTVLDTPVESLSKIFEDFDPLGHEIEVTLEDRQIRGPILSWGQTLSGFHFTTEWVSLRTGISPGSDTPFVLCSGPQTFCVPRPTEGTKDWKWVQWTQGKAQVRILSPSYSRLHWHDLEGTDLMQLINPHQ